MGLNYLETVERMKRSAGIGKDTELARELNISPQAISNFKKKGEIPTDLVIQFARSRKLSVDNILFGDDIEPIPTQDHGNGIRMSDMLTKTAEILESDTIYRTALASNINAFHQAVNNERKIEESERKIKESERKIRELERSELDLRNQLAQMEARLKALEAQLMGKQELKTA